MHDYTQDIKQWTRALLGVYARASAAQICAGRNWYASAAATVDDCTGGEWTRERRAAVCAVLSPRTTWQENITGTRKLYRAAVECSRVCPVVAGTRRNVARAWEIAQHGDVSLVSGPKVSSFYANILGDYQRVTLDVWAARAAGVAEHLMSHVDRRRYVALSQAYSDAAGRAGHTPAQFQAIAWIVMRGHGEGTQAGTNQARWIKA